MYPVSAFPNTGIGDLLDDLVEHMGQKVVEHEDQINIALIGKPNAGKSSLYNGLFNQAIVDRTNGNSS